jgi:hypothetical protein
LLPAIGGRAASFRADLPDHAGGGDLHQRRVGRVLDACGGVGAPQITDRAVIGDIGAAVGSEPYIGRAVEPADAVRESLVEGLVVREALQVQRRRLTPSTGEIDQLDLMPDLGGRRAGIG